MIYSSLTGISSSLLTLNQQCKGMCVCVQILVEPDIIHQIISTDVYVHDWKMSE